MCKATFRVLLFSRYIRTAQMTHYKDACHHLPFYKVVFLSKYVEVLTVWLAVISERKLIINKKYYVNQFINEHANFSW